MMALHRTEADGKTKRLMIVADRLVQACMAGDIGALRELGDRVDGKAAQQVIMTGGGEGDNPIKVENKNQITGKIYHTADPSIIAEAAKLLGQVIGDGGSEPTDP